MMGGVMWCPHDALGPTLTYVQFLFFQMGTHSHLFAGAASCSCGRVCQGGLLSYQSSAFFLFQMAGFRQPPAETETPNSALTRVPRQGLYLDRKIKVAGPISAISCSISEVNFLRQKMNSPKYANEAGFPWSKPLPDRVGVGRKRFMPKHLQSPPPRYCLLISLRIQARVGGNPGTLQWIF